MPRQFTLDGFVGFLRTLPSAIASAERRGVAHGGRIIRDEARAEIGHYQMAEGPFAEWEPLSDATLHGFADAIAGEVPGKIELGYAPPDNPLLRDGTLRASIESHAEGHEAVIGSHEDVALWQEQGTPDARHPIPARPFLARAAFRKGAEAARKIADGVGYALAGGAPRNSEDEDKTP